MAQPRGEAAYCSAGGFRAEESQGVLGWDLRRVHDLTYRGLADLRLPANLATYHGINDIGGYDTIGRTRCEELLGLARSFPPGPLHWPLAHFDWFDSPVLDALSVRAIAAAGPRRTPRPPQSSRRTPRPARSRELVEPAFDG